MYGDAFDPDRYVAGKPTASPTRWPRRALGFTLLGLLVLLHACG